MELIETVYRRMKRDKYVIANRTMELTEKVNISEKDLDKVVSDFGIDLAGKVKALKDAGATNNEIFMTMQKSLMAIGLTKQESAIISKKLSK